VHSRLFERSLNATGDSKVDWIVAFNTASSGCLIHYETWPDLIELLAKLSPIVHAANVAHFNT
jgi:hypothetical protein